MKTLLVLCLALAGSAAYAVDTETTPAVATPRADRVANARRAIAANDWNVAIRELQVAVKDTPQNADAHNLLGYSYRKRSNPDLARSFEHYEMALKINPQHKGAHEYIGEAYLLEKKPAQAEVHLVALERICGGRSCEEYQDLAKSIADYKAKN
jgi:Flp pilus assembly protein TadD